MRDNSLSPFVEFECVPGDEQDSEPLHSNFEPVSAATVLPEWYRYLSAFTDANDTGTSTVKLCKPFSDALQIGFMLPYTQEINIKWTDKNEIISSSGVSVYGPSPYGMDQNSRYPVPEAKIHNPWRINTPPGYSTLLTKPLNREYMATGVKPHALLVPTDTYNGPINIPITITEPEVNISAGAPLVQAIPLKRDRIIDQYQVSEPHNCTTEIEAYNKTVNIQQVRTGAYRDLFWREKKIATVASETDEKEMRYPDEISKLYTDAAPQEAAGHKIEFTVSDEDLFGVIPEPCSTADFAPPWINDVTEILQNSPGTEIDQDTEKFQSWIQGATSLGIISPLAVDTEIKQDGDGNTSISSELNKSMGMAFNRKSIGDDFPLPFGLPNLYSHWIYMTPDGYSTLFVEPFSHHQQYYRGFSGIVDSDNHYDTMNTPGRLVTSQERIHLPHGTPVTQGIPIHRDSIIDHGIIRT